MASFVIEGGHKLHGEIHPQGAKNEVLQILCATLLTSEEVTVTNIPDILDVNNLIQLLRDMGVKVSKTGIDSYTFKADTVDLNYLESDEFLKKCSSLRGSVMLVGPLVARFGRALISKPGGDKIGRRRLDTHFIGIQKLGACFNYDEERSVFSICAEHLEGLQVGDTLFLKTFLLPDWKEDGTDTILVEKEGIFSAFIPMEHTTFYLLLFQFLLSGYSRTPFRSLSQTDDYKKTNLVPKG